MTRYVIVGAGAIGGAIGGRLAHAGQQVVLVARGDHLEAMRSHGLRIRTPTEDVTVPVAAVSGPGDVQLRTDDVLVLATKTQQLMPVLREWADAHVYDAKGVIGTAGEQLPVFTATNGVAAEDLALRYFSRVFGICVWLPATRLEPGEVILRGVPVAGVLHLGRVPASTTARDSELLRGVAADWTGAGYDIRLPSDVMPWKYRKLISNLGNIFEALTGSTREVSSLREATEAEARAIFDAAGVRYTDDAEEAATRATGFKVQPVPGVEGRLGGSTWQSLARGTGDIETDYLNGEIALIAHRIGITAPINSKLARLGRQAALTGARPGDLSPEALAGELRSRS
ncbi:MAG TPA: 2-dehydropantoate 2-reductase N-terminal domain-containing protein [Propionibacteriaceae bacterium]|nr:2-dehydropantoate 2-reductase N-terminal domain-containing protein [Propionibacteriaceae bacterium]